jgi:hypothetical protein
MGGALVLLAATAAAARRGVVGVRLPAAQRPLQPFAHADVGGGIAYNVGSVRVAQGDDDRREDVVPAAAAVFDRAQGPAGDAGDPGEVLLADAECRACDADDVVGHWVRSMRERNCTHHAQFGSRCQHPN